MKKRLVVVSVAKSLSLPIVIGVLMVISVTRIAVLASVILTELTNISAKLKMASVRVNLTLPEIIAINVLLATTTFLLARHANVIPLDRQITNVNKTLVNVRARRITQESNVIPAKMVISIIRSVLVSDFLK